MILSTLPIWLRRPDPDMIGDVLVRLVLTVLVAWLLQRLGFLLVRRIERWLSRVHERPAARQRARTVGQTTRHLITTVVAAGALVHALAVIGLDVRPLLVGAGLVGAALGFGAQSLVRDLIAGAFILIEDQFSVGDAVEVQGAVALVEDITLRATRLRDFQGRLLFVPNGEMRVVVNHSRDWRRWLIDLPLSPNQDLSRALEVADAVAADVAADPEWGAQLLDPPQVMGLERVGTEGVVLRIAVRTAPGLPGIALGREVRRRALEGFLAAGLHVHAHAFTVAAPDAVPAPSSEFGE